MCVFSAWAASYAGHFGLASVVGVLSAHVCVMGLLLFFNTLLTTFFGFVNRNSSALNEPFQLRVGEFMCAMFVMKLRAAVSGVRALTFHWTEFLERKASAGDGGFL